MPECTAVVLVSTGLILGSEAPGPLPGCRKYPPSPQVADIPQRVPDCTSSAVRHCRGVLAPRDRPPGLGPRPGARRGCDWARGWRGAPTPRVGSAADESGQPLDVRPVCGQKTGYRPVLRLKQPLYTRVWMLF